MTWTPDAYTVAERVIEDGIRRGIRRYIKHRDDVPEGLNPENVYLVEDILEAVMTELAEWGTFHRARVDE